MKPRLHVCKPLWLLLPWLAGAETYYVSPESLVDGPGATWSNAYHTIQDAVDVASMGDTVLVSNGVYSTGGVVTPGGRLTNRVYIAKSITVLSLNGPEVTIIEGSPDPITGGAGDNAVRCAVLSEYAMLSGFTLRNGFTRAHQPGRRNIDFVGGGVFVGSSIVFNCHIIENHAAEDGGGCVGGLLIDCRIEGNQARSGGGVWGGRLVNCVLSQNRAWETGGGATVSRMANCLIVNNNSDVGGGVYASEGTNLVLSGNTARRGGGAVGGTLANSIVFYNTATEEGNDLLGADVSYVCSPDVVDGENGCITAAPRFVDVGQGNYRLQPMSPCIDAGSNALVVELSDLDNRIRILDGDWDGIAFVDMGAYERMGPQDRDGDWLTDVFEEALRRTDPDNPDSNDNGLSDYYEYVADLHPFSHRLTFQFLGVGANGSPSFTFDSSADRLYTLEQAANVDHTVWEPVPGFIRFPGQGGLEEHSLPPEVLLPFGAVRIIVELP